MYIKRDFNPKTFLNKTNSILTIESASLKHLGISIGLY